MFRLPISSLKALTCSMRFSHEMDATAAVDAVCVDALEGRPRALGPLKTKLIPWSFSTRSALSFDWVPFW